MEHPKIVGWSPHTSGQELWAKSVSAQKTAAFSWTGGRAFTPNMFNHPIRWTSISKGQVWCAPPKGAACGPLNC